MSTSIQEIPPTVSSCAAGRVLIVDDHPKARQSMADILRHAGHDVDCSASASEALRGLHDYCYDVILTDLKMPGMSGLEFIQAIQQRSIDAQIIMVTAHATVSSAVEAMRHGALDYLEKPLRADQLGQLVNRALRHTTVLDRKTAVPPEVGDRQPVTMIGSSPAMQTLRQRIAQIAATSETVLITGESGTGKELVARSIHATSSRAKAALVSLNCPVLSAQLMESELFGHERGAFTSAEAPRVGRFELADGGTILLDEVTEIDLLLQAKLLRVLQEKSFERVGSSDTLQVDVRVLATTNCSLRSEVAEGRFREDLYFRLAVVELQVPALRDRHQDIPELMDYFFRQASQRIGKPPCKLDSGAQDLLVHYHWPGNVRELENIITRSCVLGTGTHISSDQLRHWLIDAGGEEDIYGNGLDHQAACDLPIGLSLQEMEQKLIESTLEHFHGHRQKTAQALGIGVRTLSSKLRSYGLAPRAKTFAKAA